MPIKQIDHIDLAVKDVERSLAFYLGVFGPLGVEEAYRFPTYRGTEDVVYLRFGGHNQMLGLRQADGGEFSYYQVGLEHLAVTVDTREELDQVYERCVALNVNIQFPPEEDKDIPGYWEMFVFDPDGLRIETAYYPPEVVVTGTR
jgi:catechol 2,3-dioxygenase-like lactoylglutathione lyase family enzyme